MRGVIRQVWGSFQSYRKEFIAWFFLLVIAVMFTELNATATVTEQQEQDLLFQADSQIQTLSSRLHSLPQSSIHPAQEQIAALPTFTDIPSILVTMEQVANQTQVVITSFTFGPQGAIDLNGNSTGVMQGMPNNQANSIIHSLSVQLSIQGKTEDILQFVKELEHEPRPTAVDEVDIAQMQRGQQSTATLHCALYYRDVSAQS